MKELKEKIIYWLLLLAILVACFIIYQDKAYGWNIQEFEDAARHVCLESKVEFRSTPFCQTVYQTKYEPDIAPYLRHDLVVMVF